MRPPLPRRRKGGGAKDVYEALRAAEVEEHAFINVYDDAGGTYDHVAAVRGRPRRRAPCNAPCQSFDFGGWAARGGDGESPDREGRDPEPQPPGAPGPRPSPIAVRLTSVAASVKHLFNLSTFLTKRDAWAGNFEERAGRAARRRGHAHAPADAAGALTP